MSDITTIAAGKPPMVMLRERFEARRNELKNMLPSDISPEVFIRAFTTGATLNPKIQACTWSSIWDACIKAARAGLLPDGVEGAIVPFKTEAQWIPMVQGVLRSARRSGQLSWIDANVVRQGEQFDYAITQDGPRFLHVPGEDFKAPILRAYAVARTKDGAFYSAVMSKTEIDKHRSYSRAGRDDSPWNTWYEAMAIKTAIKGLGKYLPSVRDAVADDDSLAELPAETTPQIAAPLPAATLPEPAGASPEGGAPEVDAQHPTTPAAVESAAPREILIAYNNGADAKANNESRKDIPKQYREAERVREQIAWLAGFDAKPLPTFEEE
jgi:phage RecT family recombinase